MNNFIKRCLLLISITILFLSTFSQSVSQSWAGYLKPIATDSIKLVFNLQFENDVLTGATLDSPDQFVYDIKVSKFLLQNDTLQLAIMNLGASYIGFFQSEDFISGTFLQAGRKTPLNLIPAQPVAPPSRPQTPAPPYPYVEEEVDMNDHKGEPNIKGTLTLPQDGNIKATLILLTGSGWHDRDETIFEHKPFKVIADYLTRNGYAVYRYDDLPPKVFAQSTTFDFEKNAQTVVKYFQQDERTKNHPVGLLGHSEGGLIAFIAAANNSSIDFIISLAGPSEKMNDVLLYQVEKLNRAAGFTDVEIEETLELQKKGNQLIIKEKSTKEAKSKLGKLMDEYTKKWSTEQKKRYNFTPQSIMANIQIMTSPWYLTVMKIEPVKFIKKVKCPVYALHGEKDLQIYYEANLTLIDKNLPKNTFRKIESFPNLNHLFQTCEIGTISEYAEIEETISPVVLENILLWLDSFIY